jgi:hypothetical protein
MVNLIFVVYVAKRAIYNNTNVGKDSNISLLRQIYII